jgi:two-component system response regulator YesN
VFKVLIVDDEPLVLEGLKTMIDWGKYGFSICAEASDGEDALEIIKLMNPHLVITDIHMPVIDGLRLIKEVKEIRNLRAKFVILSGYDDFKYAKTAMHYNVNHYILKPIDVEEIEELLEKLNGELQVEMRSQKANEQTIAFITENVIHRIINGEKKESLFNKAALLLNIKDTTKIRYILMEIDHFSMWMNDFEEYEIKNKKDQLSYVVQETFQINSCMDVLLYIYQHNLYQLGLIISDKEKCDAGIMNLLIKIRKNVLDKCGFSISMFVSNSAKGIDSLSTLYEQILEIKDYRFFYRVKNIFFYEDIKKTCMSYQFYEGDLENVLKEIENNDTEKIKNGITKIFNKFYQNKVATVIIEAYIINLKAEIIKRVYVLNGNVDEFAKWILDYKIDIIKENFMQMKELVTELCLCTANYISDLQKKNSSNLIYELQKYIDNNYSKPLKLQDLADQFHMNPIYLGQLFKKKTNMYFNEYLHNIRIEKAKKLLQRTDMKISDIAKVVGYKDTEYFTNKFKEVTKILPSVYKKAEMGDHHESSEKNI